MAAPEQPLTFINFQIIVETNGPKSMQDLTLAAAHGFQNVAKSSNPDTPDFLSPFDKDLDNYTTAQLYEHISGHDNEGVAPELLHLYISMKDLTDPRFIKRISTSLTKGENILHGVNIEEPGNIDQTMFSQPTRPIETEGLIQTISPEDLVEFIDYLVISCQLAGQEEYREFLNSLDQNDLPFDTRALPKFARELAEIPRDRWLYLINDILEDFMEGRQLQHNRQHGIAMMQEDI